ncbi:MAG: pantoate--beta-alanine ligase [Acidimicrobiales bacterium]
MTLLQVTRIGELRAALDAERAIGRRVGFVPTMGYLHDGHLSLVDRARRSDDVVVASIFVNPMQFGPAEDIDAYPRDIDRDSELAAKAGVDLLFVPDAGEMYPEPPATSVAVPELAARLEGQSRPHHFAGVVTVVAKLLAIVGRCRAYFGEKDYQQLTIVRRMARDLSFPVEVVGCPTVRDVDGLALSSRNSYLDPQERAAAPVVHRALQAGAALILSGERDAVVTRDLMGGIIDAEPLAELDYVAVVDADSLTVPEPLAGNLRLLAAVGFGRARLIDNVGVTV